jgi:hypothetical protein
VQVLEVVTDALRDINVIGETQTASAEQGSTAVRKLNELMASLAEDGIDLGFAPVANTAATMDLPLGAVSTIKALLSVACASIYGAEIPAQVAGKAESGYNRLLGQAVSMQIERAKSDTLPYGNAQGSGWWDISRGW